MCTYGRVSLLVSRSYSHGGEGLERGDIVFFRSMEQYDKLAEDQNWNTGESFETNWCFRPIEILALIEMGDYQNFLKGETLSSDKVFFAGTDIDRVKNIGG